MKLYPIMSNKILCLVFSMLDISFNRLSNIENLDALVNLQKLFLVSNKIQTIENLSSLTNLTLLELGDNKIRVSFYYETNFNTKFLYLHRTHYRKSKISMDFLI